MDWQELLQWSRTGFIACCALVVQLTLSLAVGVEARATKPTVSNDPLTAEQLAVYKVILHGWMDDGKFAIHLADKTVPLPGDSQSCMKGTDPGTGDSAQVHRFRAEDLPQLGSAKIALVDESAQEKEVAENDPGTAIRSGKSVDEAVNNGFAHGLVTLSEIAFDGKHEHATLWYGFHCGELCGNGGTALLEKKDGGWVRKKNCSVWMSRQLRGPSGNGWQTGEELAAAR